MKQRLYILAFFALSVALTSCKKDEDEPAPVPEVVGKWSLDYGLLSGFQNANLNGAKIDPYSEIDFGGFFYTSQIHILNNENKTFVEVYRHQGGVEDLTGKWTFDAGKLTLDYDLSDIDNEVFTLETKDGLQQLVSPTKDMPLDSVTVGKIQYIYRK